MAYVAKFGSVTKTDFEYWYNKANPPIEDEDAERVFTTDEWDTISSELEGRMSNAFEEILESVMMDVWIGSV